MSVDNCFDCHELEQELKIAMIMEYRRGYDDAMIDQHNRIVRIITDRATDLESCGDVDECHTLARGIRLALDDIDWEDNNETTPMPPM